MSAHTPEPWTHQGGDCLYLHGVFSIKTLGDWKLRNSVLASLNACAGLEDPAEALRVAREALSRMVKWTEIIAGDNQDTEAAAEETASFELAQQALALLTPKAHA